MAAAAAIIVSSVALPAMAQCTGDGELTMNPDGTTTCGEQEAQNVFTFTTTDGLDGEVEVLDTSDDPAEVGSYVTVEYNGVQGQSPPVPQPQPGKRPPSRAEQFRKAARDLALALAALAALEVEVGGDAAVTTTTTTNPDGSVTTTTTAGGGGQVKVGVRRR